MDGTLEHADKLKTINEHNIVLFTI
jgi:hypothetical protein